MFPGTRESVFAIPEFPGMKKGAENGHPTDNELTAISPVKITAKDTN